MKFVWIFALALASGLTMSARTTTLTNDPLTGLPLYPATDSRLHLGNEPTKLPESNICRSKMQADFYSVYDSKVNATVAWYAAHLKGFRKTHAYAGGRSQNAFYNEEGTIMVSVTGDRGKEGEDASTYSIVYARLQPGVSEKTIISLNQQKIVCRE
jgi:hypothetical protein